MASVFLLALRGLSAAACRPGAGPTVLLDVGALHGVLRNLMSGRRNNSSEVLTDMALNTSERVEVGSGRRLGLRRVQDSPPSYICTYRWNMPSGENMPSPDVQVPIRNAAPPGPNPIDASG